MLHTLTAMILAGGFGTRIRPVLADCPKVLAPVNGRPFLAYLLDQLVSAGSERVILCTGYQGEQVHASLGERYGPATLIFSHEPDPMGTAGAIRQALPLVRSDPMLVLNGDSYCEVNLAAFLAWHCERRAEGSMVLTQVMETGRYGRVDVDEMGVVVGFHEKKDLPPQTNAPGWINAGIYLLSYHLITSIPTDRPVSLEREVFPAWVNRGFFGYCGGGGFIDIGTPESYAEAERFLGHRMGPGSGKMD